MWVFLQCFFIFSIETELFKENEIKRNIEKLIQTFQILNRRADIDTKKSTIFFTHNIQSFYI